MNFPFLTLITFIPVIAGAIILLLPKERGQLVKVIAAVATFLSAVLTIYIFIAYDKAAGGYQFKEGPYDWVKSLGISYFVGADGISLVMLILTGIVSFMGVLISWGINERPKEFFAFFLFADEALAIASCSLLILLVTSRCTLTGLMPCS